MKKFYKADFPIVEKIEVNGPGVHPIFSYLRSNTKELMSVKEPGKTL